MSAEPARHLAAAPEAMAPEMIVVDPDGMRVGVLGDFVQKLEDEIAGLQRDVRGWAARHAELKRDKDAEAEESPVWPAALRVFKYWRTACKHPRSEFTLDRFEMIRPHLEKLAAPGKDRSTDAAERLAHAEAVCKLAVDGIAFDPYISVRKNGTKKRNDGWHLCFGTRDQFENRCNAAPLERIREVMGPAPTLDQAQATQ
jgi:hypothetical protein